MQIHGRDARDPRPIVALVTDRALALAPDFAALGRRGLREDTADIRYIQIGALAGPEAAVPSAVLRSRKLTISGSGAGSVPAAEIKAQLPRYLRLIADGSVQVPFRTFPLSEVAEAWTTSAESGPRVVLVRD